MSRYCLTSFNISIKIAVFGICFHFALYSHIFFLYLLQIRIEINTRRIAQWEIWSSFKTQFVTKINTCSLWYITACFPTSPAFIYNDIFVYASLRQKNKEIRKSSNKICRRVYKYISLLTKLSPEPSHWGAIIQRPVDSVDLNGIVNVTP